MAKDEVDDHASGAREDVFPPKWLPEGEAPFGAREPWFELSDLDQADRVRFAIRHHPVAEVPTEASLQPGPVDELRERLGFDRRTTHETDDGLGGQHVDQSRRITRHGFT